VISVVVPYRNERRFLLECLRSLEGQCGLSQVVIVDDASDEPLVEVPFDTCPVKILRLWEHGGVQRARNVGWHYVRTRSNYSYTLFCDQDITWKKGAFQSLSNALAAAYRVDTKIAYSYCCFERHGSVTGDWIPGDFDAKRLAQVNFVSTMSLVYTKTLPSPPFVEDEERLQDWSLWLRMLQGGRTGVFVNKVLFSAFYNDECISTRDDADYHHWTSVMRERYVGRKV